jgi:hypothetical protein
LPQPWTGVLEKLREQFPEEINGILGTKEGA